MAGAELGFAKPGTDASLNHHVSRGGILFYIVGLSSVVRLNEVSFNGIWRWFGYVFPG
jgi:hypothetical protein